jgi:hypothetical protein
LGVRTASLDVSFFHKFKTFCEYALHNKLHKSTIFIIFGPMDQKLWGHENSGRSLVKVASVGTNEHELTTAAQKGGQQEEGGLGKAH